MYKRLTHLFCALFFMISSAVLAVEFNVATYNVQMRPFLDANSHKGPRISPKLNGYDIVSLQESFTKKGLLLKKVTHPYQAHFTELRHCFSFVDSGLSTLSRYPILLQKAVHFNAYAGFSDSIASKGILLTRLNVDGLILDVYSTHMQAGYTDSENSARYSQTEQLVNFVKENSPIENSVVIIGDFNMGPFRPGKRFDEYAPKHYENDRDMEFRTAAFEMMMQELMLTDVQDTLLSHQDDDIHRIVFRSGMGHNLTPISVHNDGANFLDEKGKPLSDSAPLVAFFKLTRNKSNYVSFNEME